MTSWMRLGPAAGHPLARRWTRAGPAWRSLATSTAVPPRVSPAPLIRPPRRSELIGLRPAPWPRCSAPAPRPPLASSLRRFLATTIADPPPPPPIPDHSRDHDDAHVVPEYDPNRDPHTAEATERLLHAQDVHVARIKQILAERGIHPVLESPDVYIAQTYDEAELLAQLFDHDEFVGLDTKLMPTHYLGVDHAGVRVTNEDPATLSAAAALRDPSLAVPPDILPGADWSLLAHDGRNVLDVDNNFPAAMPPPRTPHSAHLPPLYPRATADAVMAHLRALGYDSLPADLLESIALDLNDATTPESEAFDRTHLSLADHMHELSSFVAAAGDSVLEGESGWLLDASSRLEAAIPTTSTPPPSVLQVPIPPSLVPLTADLRAEWHASILAGFQRDLALIADPPAQELAACTTGLARAFPHLGEIRLSALDNWLRNTFPVPREMPRFLASRPPRTTSDSAPSRADGDAALTTVQVLRLVDALVRARVLVPTMARGVYVIAHTDAPVVPRAYVFPDMGFLDSSVIPALATLAAHSTAAASLRSVPPWGSKHARNHQVDGPARAPGITPAEMRAVIKQLVVEGRFKRPAMRDAGEKVVKEAVEWTVWALKARGVVELEPMVHVHDARVKIEAERMERGMRGGGKARGGGGWKVGKPGASRSRGEPRGATTGADADPLTPP
ncbi:hypothetical protein AMAG_03788 [Allomyces macrogynus ATCC 38327]|uniref:Uncharacterized protein n=1 Tax=Allomyces macrogynus (strain ATCC 38327) TaxID=578462 RepID=A0A0L0SAQ9_ALLM3|nr:hypothetical protein AMAG_03788 [Allomyces macrogynus ATCC 38327]|eukprot:KNE59517.1 hypothetical protein AMAG_03788 [Allomyces macrogynus ATCC 38327]